MSLLDTAERACYIIRVDNFTYNCLNNIHGVFVQQIMEKPSIPSIMFRKCVVNVVSKQLESSCISECQSQKVKVLNGNDFLREWWEEGCLIVSPDSNGFIGSQEGRRSRSICQSLVRSLRVNQL